MRILSIESSCDETAISITKTSPKDWNGKCFKEIKVLGDSLNSQAELHSEFGGVYPNVAKREHSKNFVPVLTHTLLQANLLQRIEKPSVSKDKIELIKETLSREPELFARLLLFLAQYEKPNIDAVAAVVGPGLAPALWVGVNFAKALSIAWDLPLIPLNHMEGHFYSAFFPEKIDNTIGAFKLKEAEYPILVLLLSGGHTEIVEAQDVLRYRKLGWTLDDAVGEAYDKVARLLGFTYPGGPKISELSHKYEEKLSKSQVQRNPKIKLPRPKIHDNDLNFSFSGLKTAVLRLVNSFSELTDEIKEEIAYEFEKAVEEVMVSKLTRAIDAGQYKTIVFAGGVSANKRLRSSLKKLADDYNINLYLPPLKLTGDNSLMSALSAHTRLQVLGEKAYLEHNKFEAKSNWEIDQALDDLLENTR